MTKRCSNGDTGRKKGKRCLHILLFGMTEEEIVKEEKEREI